MREIYQAWAVADDRLVLAVVDHSTGAMVGEIVLNEWDQQNHSCNFRTLIGASGCGRGLGTEATRLMVRHGLTTLGLHRISLEVYDFNPRARRIYGKAGSIYEGTGRDALRFDDAWVDVHYMAVIAPN
ncbi:GNAT family N-acetyltransferase [Kocuria sp. TGY1127_2]|uniref:GNAT family N-acetyltransferase n=1 Tax=Kocuria sp. TGY1127_2 TaxID=2711328 RepID=UPI0015BDF5EE|nr:GNAT family protein [Kocuria sp. TGY1127_2]